MEPILSAMRVDTCSGTLPHHLPHVNLDVCLNKDVTAEQMAYIKEELEHWVQRVCEEAKNR